VGTIAGPGARRQSWRFHRSICVAWGLRNRRGVGPDLRIWPQRTSGDRSATRLRPGM